jgi:uncharacterized protein
MLTPYFQRNIEPRLFEALQDTPVVLLVGPRQTGKTTLVKQVAKEKGMQYLTLDDELTRLSAKEDPIGFVRRIEHGVIDEIQRAPNLLLAIKKSVDDNRQPGRFLLTGSANIMTLPTVADSLAGRMETLSLLPLSQSELHRQTANWVDHVFNQHILRVNHLEIGESLIDRVLQGGFPEAISRSQERRRVVWFRQYIDAIVQRDVRDITEIDKLDQLPILLRAVSQTSGQVCNYSKLGGQLGLDSKTVAKYVGVLEKVYLLKRVEVCANTTLGNMTKTPKIQFIDSGLLSSLMGIQQQEVLVNRQRFGHLLESFVYGELLKHISTANESYQVLYYRDQEKIEVDFVITNPKGHIVGIEVKASATVHESELKGLKKLANHFGNKFQMGVVLYDGTETMPLGNHIWAVPFSSLWGQL